MKIIIIIITLLVSLGNFCFGNTKTGLVDSDKQNHYKIYEEDGKYSYYSITYNEILPLEFEDDLALIFEFKIEDGEMYSINVITYIDKSGNVVLRPNVYSARPFSEGLAAVMPSEGSAWGYIDKTGEMVIQPQYRTANKFQDGFASVYIANDGGKWMLINKAGEYVREIEYPLN